MKTIKVMDFLKVLFCAVISVHISFAATYDELKGSEFSEDDVKKLDMVWGLWREQSEVNEFRSDINYVCQRYLKAELSFTDAKKMIKGHIININTILSTLNEQVAAIKKAHEKTDTGYLSSFISGAKNLGKRIIAPFQSDGKEIIAQIIIDVLVKQQELAKDYEEELKKISVPKVTNGNSDYDILTKRYEELTAYLKEEIYQQQLITGAVMSSMKRKLFWASIAAGAVAAGIYLLAPGTEMTSEMVEKVKEKVAVQPDASITLDTSVGK